MADEKNSTLNWDEVSIDEQISDVDFKKAETLGTQAPVGLFLCEVESVGLIEKTMKEYTCAAGKLSFKVLEVIELEQPVFGDDKKPVIRNGEPLMKINPVSGALKSESDAKYIGMMLHDEVCMYHPKEKEGMKNRRLFIARKIGILAEGSNELTAGMWRTTPGRRVLIRTEWNSWTDKDTKEIKKNVRVAFSGYESASTLGKTNAQKQEEIDLAGV